MHNYLVLRMQPGADVPHEVDQLEEPSLDQAWRTYEERYLHDERPGTLIFVIGPPNTGEDWWDCRRVMRSANRLVPA